MTIDLFATADEAPPPLPIAEGAVLLPGYALPHEGVLQSELARILEAAPLRQMFTPGGFRMSVGTTSCGALGWITDRRGYRYSAVDPLSDQPWPPMPAAFMQLAHEAASAAGFDGFVPDACLVNRYAPGARMSLHQDRDERDFGQPIVSVSLGLPAVFQFGGAARADKAQRVPLAHGDVVVWGGPARLRFHGVLPLKEGRHPFMGECRINLTFRKAA